MVDFKIRDLPDEETSPADGDFIAIDDVSGAELKKITWTNIKVFLKTYFDTLYNKYVHPNHSGDVTSVADGVQTIVNKQTLSATPPITLSNTPTVIAGDAPVIAIPAATASVPGHATADQITKLDGIEALATKYPDIGEQAFLDADHTKLDGIEALADVTDDVNIASSIHGVAGKTTPVNADEVGLIDSAASYVLKKLTWANLKATLKTYMDTLYLGITTKLDDLAAPDDNTDLDASITKHGLLKKLGGGTANFLRADGSWAVPAGAPSIPSGAKMYFYANVAPAGWTIDSAIADRVLAVKGGSQAYNVSGGTGAGTWTQPNHTLVTAEVPAHTHGSSGAHTSHTFSPIAPVGGVSGGEGNYGSRLIGNFNVPQGLTIAGGAHTHTSVGGGGAHNHGETYRPLAAVGIIATKD